MKQLFHILVLLFIANIAIAQAPQGIPYQAAARNSSGAVLASTAISVRFTIRDSIATGIIKYRDTHSVTTTAQGMFSVNVGQGTVVTGTFAGINWATNAKFLQVEMDPAGGSSYIELGTQQTMSVPYALNSGSLKLRVSATGDTLYSGGGNYVIIPGISAANCTLPTLGAISGTATVCAGSTSTLSNATTGGTWSSSATGIATVGSAGLVTGAAAGTTTISYTVTNSCGSAVATRVVTVNALPSAGSITGTATVCGGSTTTLSNATTGGAWSSAATGVATVGSTGIVTGIAAGTAIISYTVTNGCGSASTTRVVTVNPLPSAGTIAGTATVCAGSTTALSNATAGGAWSSSAAGVATLGSTGVVTGVASGTATVSYTVTNGCGSASTTRVATVNALPNAGSITGTATVTAGSTTTLSNATTGGAWSSSATGIATVGSTGVVTGVAAGTATISYTVTNSCGSAVATTVVTVNAAAGLPIITTTTVGAIVSCAASSGGTISSDGGFAITARGVVWSTSPGPTVALTTKTNDGTGTGPFTSSITGLTASTTYYVRAYATNSSGTTYGTESSFTTLAGTMCIGATFGGGKIAYIYVAGDLGYVAGETHGLIAAPSDQSTGIIWGCYGTLVGGTSTALGTGAANTAIVSAACGAGTAARLCADLVLNGYSDWYLPSIDELQKLYINRSAIGGFASDAYWSSSEYNAGYAWLFVFYLGGAYDNAKYYARYVRAVRAF